MSVLARIMEMAWRWPYRPTALSARGWARALIHTLFPALPMPEILLEELDGAWAEYEAPGTIYMVPEYTSHQQFIAVLAHELVHHWQHTHGHELNHGPTFWQWAKPLAEIGITLSEDGDVHLG